MAKIERMMRKIRERIATKKRRDQALSDRLKLKGQW